MEQILYADFTKSNLEDGSLGDIHIKIYPQDKSVSFLSSLYEFWYIMNVSDR